MAELLKELDVVVAKRDLKDSVTKGTNGTIVYVYDSGVFEVEFIDDKGHTISVQNVTILDIKRDREKQNRKQGSY
jgi:hypothetical protein